MLSPCVTHIRAEGQCFPHCPNCTSCMILFRMVLVPRRLPLSVHHYPWAPCPGTTRALWCPSDPDPPLNPGVDSDPDDNCCVTCWDHSGLEHMPSIANPFATSFPCTLTCAGTCSHVTSLPGFTISWSSISQTGTWSCRMLSSTLLTSSAGPCRSLLVADTVSR